MKHEISENLQNSVVYLTATDTDFARIVANQIPPEFFSNEIISEIYSICVKFVLEFGRAPGIHLQDELIKYIKDKPQEKRELIAKYLQHIENLHPNKEYVLSRLNDFIRSRALIKATYEFAELVERGEYVKATKYMQDALKAGIQQKHSGVDYVNANDLNFRNEEEERLFRLGIPPIDKYVKIKRGDLIVIAGPYKGTKSWAGHYIAKRCLIEGLNVLHVSHENSLQDTLIRYDMLFGGLVADKEQNQVEVRWLENGEVMKQVVTRPSVYDKKKVLKARKKVGKYGGRLIVQKYPMGMCSPIELETYIDYLENFENFKADVVINDYADIMSPLDRTKQTRDSINEVYIYLKRIADDRNLCMVTMSQINDEGLKTLIKDASLEGRHLAEDKRKFANIDKGFFVGTTPQLKQYEEAVLGCFANRTGKQGNKVIIGQNLSIGQFCVYWYKFNKDEI